LNREANDQQANENTHQTQRIHGGITQHVDYKRVKCQL
jgi:hypothetical protein